MIKNQDKLDFDDTWIDELFQWADNNNIPELQYIEDDTLCDDGEFPIQGFWIGLPRDRDVLVNLEELDLSWHNCCEIPKQIKHLKKLKKFIFSKSRDGRQPPFMKNADGLNEIEEIPVWIAELENLEELDLSNNKISFVPDVIGKLKNLKKLYLHNNLIMFVDVELAFLSKLEVIWIYWNMFSVLDNCIDNLKELANLDVDWKQPNKLSLLSDCLEQIFSQEWTDENLLGLATEKLSAVTHGIEQLQKRTGPHGIETLWREWSRLTNLKYKLKNLKGLRELYCDGLSYPNGPIKLYPGGVIVMSKTLQKTECCVDILIDNIPVSFVTNDSFEVKIELNDHHDKSLMEKIDFIGLWQ